MVSHPPVGLISRRFVQLACAALLGAGCAGPLLADTQVRGSQSTQQSATAAEDDRFLALLRAEARRAQSVDPLEVLYRGRRADTSVFEALFTPGLDQKQRVLIERSLSEVDAFGRAGLSPERQLSFDAFAFGQRQRLARLTGSERQIAAVFPITHFGGLHAEFPGFFAATGPLPFANEDNYRRNLALLCAWPEVVDSIIARFREGMAAGVTEHSAPVHNMIAQIDTILAVPVAESPFLAALRNPPAAIPDGRRSRLRRDYTRAVEGKVYPAYRRLRTFLAEAYLPRARPQPGLSSLPGGPALYAQLIEAETGRVLDPDVIHALGNGEVARIKREMDAVVRKLGFNGSLHAFFEHLRTDPRFHPSSAAELRDGFEAVARKVDRQLPRFFLRRPRTRLEVTSYPAWQERFEAGGSYDEGTADGTRPGIFYFNTYDLQSRYLTGITTLYLHEGVPGHHFQISLAKESSHLPDFQRFGGNSAFVEGWAVYAETLGYEMGLYKDPMQHWGTLDDEMLRAMRLVVDTGIHAKGWSRERALAYLLGNSGIGRTDAEAEVDRYIARPGQALSYKLGALEIQALRSKAEAALGPRFDLRQFHDQVLGSGALPILVLEAKIERWIATEARK